MKVATLFLVLTIYTVSGLDNFRTDKINKIPAEHRLVGIQGGKEIDFSQRPYVVAIVDDTNTYLGSGALVSKNWVLTAATNVYGRTPHNTVIRYGNSNALKGLKATTKRIVIHTNYTRSWSNDLALIKLTRSVSKRAKQINLSDILPRAGASATVTGYGSTTYSFNFDGILRDVSVPFIPYTKCKSHYAKIEPSFSKQNFCASKQGAGACPLDWGAPLVYRQNLIGIFTGSYGDCGSTQFPGAYNDITQFRKWIQNTIKT